jgi:hypothetical protein
VPAGLWLCLWLAAAAAGTSVAYAQGSAETSPLGPASANTPSPAAPAEAPRQVEQALTLDPGASCLERGRLIDRIARWRERATLDLPIRVYVRGDAQSPTRVFFSVVRDGTQPTERVLEDAPADCDQLHSAVALSIALAIDAIVSESQAHAQPLPAAPSPPAPESPRRQQRTAPYVELGLLGGASVGIVTNTALAGLPRVQISPLPWLAFALAGLVTHSDHATIQGAVGDFSSTLFAGGVDVCVGGETAERLSFFMCGGARGGGFTTDGYGYFRDFRRTRAWFGLSASGQARAWILPSVAIGLSVEALFALAERKLAVLSETAVAEPHYREMPRLGLTIAVGPVFRFY